MTGSDATAKVICMPKVTETVAMLDVQKRQERSRTRSFQESRSPTNLRTSLPTLPKHRPHLFKNMDGPPLASLSLTHVNYDPTSTTSLVSAYLALVPQALMITYTAFIYSTRELEIALMFAGQLACEGLNFILKRYIQEERPTKVLGKGYGMPSSHAQFVGYFSVYLVLFLLLRHDPYKPNSSSTHVPAPMWQRLVLAAFIVAGSIAVAQSRIILNYHTPRQVYIGFSIGMACAVAYFIALTVARHFGILDAILDTSLARWVRLRDLLANEDMVDAGWERWDKQRASRKSKEKTK